MSALAALFAALLASAPTALAAATNPGARPAPLAHLIAESPLVDERRELLPDGAHALRIRIVHARFKRPLLRVEDTIAAADVGARDPVPLRRNVSVADQAIVRLRDGIAIDAAIARISSACAPRAIEAQTITSFAPAMGRWLRVTFDGAGVDAQADVLTQLRAQSLGDVVDSAQADGIVGLK